MKLALTLVIGVTLGLTIPGWLTLFTAGATTHWLLIAMLFFVGFGMGNDWEYMKKHWQFSWLIVLLPVISILGSLTGGFVAALITSLSPGEGVLVSSGFGYYSLSSILITNSVSADLGAIALLSNIVREVGTILLAPLLVMFLGRYSPIAAAGATSGDTCLPIISKLSGKDLVPLAVINGFLQTVLVTPMVTMLIELIR